MAMRKNSKKNLYKHFIGHGFVSSYWITLSNNKGRPVITLKQQ
jgi:hypothetical protein